MKLMPHITVAAVIEKDGRYLMVKEIANRLAVYNQPAGHWEVDETLPAAAIRETLEETAWDFLPQSLIGIYRWQHPQKHDVYLRITFSGQAIRHHQNHPLDESILDVLWMTRAEIEALPEMQRRSAMVLKSIRDYENGRRYDLSILSDVVEHW